MIKDALGERMKEYESVNRFCLTRRIPVIIRIDGKAFHTFTKGFIKPFDEILIATMQETMKYLCENIQGCVLGYTQSDEITLVLTDYTNKDTDAWFDYNIQKIASVSASLATFIFNKKFKEKVEQTELSKEQKIVYLKAIEKGAIFDSRVFNIPKEEVANCLIWRQQDATKNSISSVAQKNFSHKELQGINSKDLQNKLLTERNINWNHYSIPEKRGTCCKKIEVNMINDNGDSFIRNKWTIDKEIPIFTENRNYIEELI